MTSPDRIWHVANIGIEKSAADASFDTVLATFASNNAGRNIFTTTLVSEDIALFSSIPTFVAIYPKPQQKISSITAETDDFAIELSMLRE